MATGASPATYPTPAAWANQDIVLYHGTIDSFSGSILGGVDVTRGRVDTDFGRGFYTTTDEDQARRWARRLSRRRAGTNPVVVRFEVPRNDLASLDSVWFVRGAPDAEDYWSLVHRFRTARGHLVDHARAATGWYDLAIGPLAGNWSRRQLAIQDGDQISFHTAAAASVLDVSSKTSYPA
jgi:hypothetical protein